MTRFCAALALSLCTTASFAQTDQAEGLPHRLEKQQERLDAQREELERQQRELDEIQAELDALRAGGEAPVPAAESVRESPDPLLYVFQILAIAVVVIEVIIPIVCLVPRIERLKHLVILPFVIATSLFTPEFTFLTLAALMGLMQCREDESKTRWTYVAVIILMNAYAYAFVWDLEWSPGLLGR